MTNTSSQSAQAQPMLTHPGLLACTVTIALAGLLFGFDTAVISGTTELLRAEFDLTPLWLGVTVSSALFGTLVGALFAGRPGDRYGSRDCLRALAVLYIVSALGSAIAWDWASLVFFRVIGGLAVGGSSALAPVYISEVAPAKHRGRLVASFQFCVILGILLAYVSNAIISGFDMAPSAEWRWKFGIATLPSLVFMWLLMRIPNSPRWLIAKGRDDEARSALNFIGLPQAQAEAEIREVRGTLDKDSDTEKLSWTRHRKPIMLAILVAAFNQFSGINALLYYLNDIFAAAGGALSPDTQAIIIGIVNMIFTCVGLMLIDRIGRRTLLLIGSAGMTVSLVVAGLAMSGVLPGSMLLVALIVFIAFFAPGSGAVIWVYISEVFPTPVRGRGGAVGASSHWGFNAVIALIFPTIAAVSESIPFYFFAVMMAVQFVVVLAYFPETKGVSLEKMSEKLGVKMR
ncbi:sugar porter family MFS transporter [Paenirhodobacter populi]|uniref:Sugar porter family MFS transporter n=1 Tax=Paenirhodobacter populi TaxID=2306993 RepID=A0A443IW37_9RHOB|nr:sugar porter family MFS transporter [Sinirhodobacter populi]RWR12286.1 sugar porter family MFS transporter [Sinirhodobacter populi]